MDAMTIDTYFCFCCLATNDLCPLYHDTDADHGGTLLQLFNVNISYEDYEYDSYICKECIEQLRQVVRFKTQVFDILNSLQSNGLIELLTTEQGVTVKKVTDGQLLEEKYEKLVIKDVVTLQLEPEDRKQPPIKNEPAQDKSLLKPERDKTSNGEGQIAQYEEELKCDICQQALPNMYVYHLHMNQHFPNHICDTCGKGFLTEKRLKRHLPSHKKGPFKCHQCDAEFTNYNTFNSHRQRLHASEPLYRCPRCPERFPTLSRRAAHQARAHSMPARVHRCHICSKTFLLAGYLTAHIKYTHQKVKRHWCRECRAGFPLRRELAAHTASHTNRDMFHCDQCPKRYPRKKALIVHMRTHTDDRRFSCEFCGKRFIQKCTLMVHLKIHNRATDKSAVAEK